MSAYSAWVWPKERTEIVPNVWLGNADDAMRLWRRPGWTIIDVREMDTELDPPSVIKIPLLRSRTHGNAGRKALGLIADAIDAGLKRGDQVLVHCWVGKERSPLAVAAWLVTSRGLTLDAAYAWIMEVRPVADCRSWLTRSARRALEHWDELAARLLVA